MAFFVLGNLHGTVPQNEQTEIISHNMCTIIIRPEERKNGSGRSPQSMRFNNYPADEISFSTACKSLTPAVVSSYPKRKRTSVEASEREKEPREIVVQYVF